MTRIIIRAGAGTYTIASLAAQGQARRLTMRWRIGSDGKIACDWIKPTRAHDAVSPRAAEERDIAKIRDITHRLRNVRRARLSMAHTWAH